MTEPHYLITGSDGLKSVIYTSIWLGSRERVIARAEMLLAADPEIAAITVTECTRDHTGQVHREQVHETRVPF